MILALIPQPLLPILGEGEPGSGTQVVILAPETKTHTVAKTLHLYHYRGAVFKSFSQAWAAVDLGKWAA